MFSIEKLESRTLLSVSIETNRYGQIMVTGDRAGNDILLSQQVTKSGAKTMIIADGVKMRFAGFPSVLIQGKGGNDNIRVMTNIPWQEDMQNDVYGGNGDDNIYISTDEWMYVSAGNGNDFIRVEEQISGSKVKEMALSGDAGNDTIFGASGREYIHGGDGDDFIRAGDGNDYISDGLGNDNVDGEEGYDQFYIGAGTNTIFGGDDDDIFRYDYQDGSRDNLLDTIDGGDGDYDAFYDIDPNTAPAVFSNVEIFQVSDGGCCGGGKG